MNGKRHLRLAAVALVVAAQLAAAADAAAQPQLLTGLVLAAPRLLVALGERSLLVSADAGASWRSTSVPDVRSLGGAFVLDRSHWWIASAPPGSRVTIARTHYGGAHWRRAMLPFVYRGGYGAGQFSFVDARRGWLTVDTVHRAAFANVDLYATGDGGASWRRLGSFPFTGPILFRGERGFALAGVGGTSLETSADGGRSWRPRRLLTPMNRMRFGQRQRAGPGRSWSTRLRVRGLRRSRHLMTAIDTSSVAGFYQSRQPTPSRSPG